MQCSAWATSASCRRKADSSVCTAASEWVLASRVCRVESRAKGGRVLSMWAFFRSSVVSASVRARPQSVV